MKKYVKLLIIGIFLFFTVGITTSSFNVVKNNNIVYAEGELQLNELSFDNFNLSPSFNPSEKNYSIQITENVVDLIPTYSVEDGVEVTITGNKYIKSSNGTITITLKKDDQTTTYNIAYSKSLDGLANIENKETTFDYTGSPQSYIAPYTANYKIELWGASGGSMPSRRNNYAAYTAGEITLQQGTQLYVYVGERGKDNHQATYNGGGAGGIGGSDLLNYGYSGGGATDIRLYSSDDGWNDQRSLASRIMVAAGSGGSVGATQYDNAGDHSVAGGLNGYSGSYYSGHTYSGTPNGQGATQTVGGLAGSNQNPDDDENLDEGINNDGVFGIGGSSYSTSSNRGAGGGGGGYYGGGAGGGVQRNGYGLGGGGGSSFISGHTGSIAITGESDLSPKCNPLDTLTESCSIHYSGYRFTNTKMIDGNSYRWTTTKNSKVGYPNIYGEEDEEGNIGDGYAKITLISLPSDDNYLTSITSTGGTFDKAFDPTVFEYNLTLDAYTSKFSLSGVKSDESATVTGLNTEYTLALNETKKIQIKVTSASGAVKVYNVNAQRLNIDTNAHSSRLKAISINEGEYEIDFEPLVTTYQIDIKDSLMELPIVATPFDEDAQISITGNYYMKEKTGAITITVTSEGATPRTTTYTINYNKNIKDYALSDIVTTFSYTGNVQEFLVPYTGDYKIELWGGSGTNSAYGAYTSGYIKLTKGDVYYIYVGNLWTGGGNKATFNNGTGNQGGYNGGGSTDIRYVGGSWNNFDSLKSRLMVAAGGGCGDHPGAAGGLEGYSGGGTVGGTQTAPGVRQSTSYTNSAFGQAMGGCTGGNGYYPGGGATCVNGAGGGSSFISGHQGCNAIAENSTSSSIIHTNQSVHYSGLSFNNTKMVDGQGYEWTTEKGMQIGMPTFNGTGTMNGNSGAGYAKITLANVSNDNYLSTLQTDISSFTPEFNPATFEYTLNLDKYEPSFTLTGTTSDEDATVSGLGTYNLEPGQEKQIRIQVTANSGNVKTYVINAKRGSLNPGEHDSKLSKLSVKNFKFDKTFTSLETTYNIEYNSNIIDFEVTYDTYDEDATVTITGDKYITGDSGVIVIDVTAPSVAPTTYRINYRRLQITDADFVYNYTNTVQEFVAPYGGTYQVQLWGASGGDYDVNLYGGRGAYTSGKITLNKGDKFYVYVGSQASSAQSNTLGGYNGGGNAPSGKDKDGRAGGGATDIRLLSGDPTNLVSLTSRIMVAGGGGGAAYESSDTWRSNGGNGGGLSGYAPTLYGGSAGGNRGTGATQTSGGYASNASSNTVAIGTFGQGGRGISTDGGSGGGGGYYGGGGSNVCSGGGGGSSFISGHEGAVAIDSEGNTTPRKNSHGVICANGTTDITCSYHYSGYIFTDTVMIGGNENMPNHNNTTTMTGNSGNGYAKFTFLDALSDDNYLTSLSTSYGFVSGESFDKFKTEYHVALDKYTRTFDVNAIASSDKAKVTGTKKYTLEPGTSQDITITVISESGKIKTYTIHASREEWPDTEDTNLLKNLTVDKYELNPNFSANQFNYTVNVYDTDIDLSVNPEPFDKDAVATVEGYRYIKEDTGTVTIRVSEPNLNQDAVYTITYTKIKPSMAPLTVTYSGNYVEWTAPYSAKYNLEAWGAAGGGNPVSLHTTNSSGGPGGYTQAIFSIEKGTKLYIYAGEAGKTGVGLSTYGGPVGGYNGGGNGGNAGSGSGGGATDIRLTPGEWNNLDSLKSRIVVAGGGGGADDQGGTLNGSNDGSGGAGGNLTGQGAFYDGVEKTAYGGTQTNGYAFGQGGHVTANTDTGGGGGGYYGGTCTNYGNGGGGGGSSYIKNYPGADITYLDYQKDPDNPNNIKYISGTMQRGVNMGDGYARISLVSLNDTDVYLNSLTSDTGEFDETFDRLNGEYHLTIDKYVGLYTLSGTLSSDKATVTGLDVQYAIDNDETQTKFVTVTAESGDTKIYKVIVHRNKFKNGEHSARLKSLVVDPNTGYELNEDFYSNNTEYSLNIYSNEIDTFINYTTYDNDAIVTVSGDKYVKRGFGIITVTVYDSNARDGLDENNIHQTTYNITYTKTLTDEPSKNNYLKSLTPSVSKLIQSDGETEGYNVLEQNYTLHLDALQTGVRFTAEVDDEKADVRGDNEFYKVEPGESREVKIYVTSAFTETREYTITITRDDLPNEESALLKSLRIKGYDNDIEFDGNTFAYNIVLPQGEIDLDIEAIPLSSNATTTVSNTKHLTANSGAITITVNNNNANPSEKVYTINYLKYNTSTGEFAYTGDYQTFTAPYTGKYTFELWGAQGGYGRTTTTYQGGKGSYTKGTIELKKGQKLYIYVGGQGTNHEQNNNTNVPGGWNGGGAGGDDNQGTSDTGGGGGGATDISLIPETIEYDETNKVYRRSQKSYSSRIMVAAGGGGGAWNTVNPGQGSNGGGLVIAGYNTYHGTTAYANTAGSQTSGYAFGYGESGTDNVNVDAKGGGGAGYFTGVNPRYGGQGAGGTSYISGHTGSIAIKGNNDIEPRLGELDSECVAGTTDNLCSIHYSGLYFTNTQIIDGTGYEWRNTIGAQINMPTQDKTSTMQGNTGNGFARVTMESDQDNYLNTLVSDHGTFDIAFDPLKENYVLNLDQYEAYFTLTGTLSSNKAQVTGLNKQYTLANSEQKDIYVTVTAENGDIKVYTIHAQREAYHDTHSTKLKSLFVYDYESSFVPKFSPNITSYDVKIDEGDVELYVYYEAYDNAANVDVKINGGTTNNIVGHETGFVILTVTAPNTEDTVYRISYSRLEAGQRLYDFDYTGDFQVFKAPVGGRYKLQTWGAQGGYRSSSAYGGKGGYAEGIITLKKNEEVYVYVGGSGNNGGFNGGGTRPTYNGGGGATDISMKSGAWDSSDHLYSRVLVAGGGGSDGAANRTGMYGGGTTGGSATQSYGSGGTGATQIAAGTSASFGKGGNGTEAAGGYAGAGGGGWYGGGGSTPDGGSDDDRGGGGGSAFAYDGTVNPPSGYSVDASYKLTNTKLIAGNASMPTYYENTVSMTGNEGNGHARITLLDSISKDNYLKSLSTAYNYGTWNKIFDPNEQNYVLKLDAYTPEFILEGETSSKKASVTGLGRYEIENGETKVIDVVVTAESGDIRTYKVTITRDPYLDTHSSKLSKLTINDTLQLDLIKEFNSKETDYTLQIYHNLADLNIYTETYDEDATVSISGVNHLSDQGVVRIVVSAPDVADTIYTITYTRDKSLEGYIPTNKDVINTYEYTGSYQTFTAPANGEYLFELWGAQGNYVDANRAIGGKGAFTTGILNLEKDQTFYVYVGQNRKDRTASWNAGGSFGGSSDTTNGGSTNGYGGGGATDVRITKGDWNNADSLRSRIMVAAGGGGATNYAYPASGGAGGALVGLPGQNGKYPNAGEVNTVPTGATQTNGGTTTVIPSGASGGVGAAGSFGVAGNGNSSWGSAGGGGWYGGAGGGYSSNSVDSGAGGSSYISGYKGAIATLNNSNSPRLDSTGLTCVNGTTDIECSKHYSNFVFSETKMLSGEEEMPTHDGLSTMVGNEGNGYARITQILLNEDNYLNNITSDYGTWNRTFDSLVGNYQVHLTQNDPTITFTTTKSSDDEVVEGDGYYEIALGETKVIVIKVTAVNGAEREYTITVTRDGWDGVHTSKLSFLEIYNNYDEEINLNEPFNSNRTNYTFDLYENYFNVKIVATPLDPQATYEVINYEYLHETTDTVTVVVHAPEVADTTYNLTYTKTDYFDYESLAGGDGLDANGGVDFAYTGGEQTYTTNKGGYFKLETWGAQGGSGSGGYGAYAVGYAFAKSHTTFYINVGGQGSGRNGGYNGGGGVSNAYGGGGATHIALRSGVLSSLSNYRGDVLIVSGAGGGYGMSYAGGHAGGIQGNYGRGDNPGYPGNQTSGGSGVGYGSNAGGFGYGGYGDWSGEPLGGGGAGWYGGSAAGGLNNNGSGGGGSSYIANPLLESLYGFTKHMTCYSCTTSNVESTLTYSVTNASSTPTEDYAKLGHGYARISYVGRASDDNYLTAITSNVGTITQHETNNQEFSPIVKEYDLVIDKYDEYFTLSADLSDPDADIIGPGEYRLEPGASDTYDIVVTAQSGDVRTYKVHARRESLAEGKHTTKLKDLDIVGYEDSFTPRFHSLIYDYDIVLSTGIIDLSIVHKAYDDQATVVVTSDSELNKIDGEDIYYVKEDTGTFTITVSLPSNLVDPEDDDTKPSVYRITYDKNTGGRVGYAYTGSYQTFTAPITAPYRIELWGAQGGSYENDGRGEKGAYTAGTLNLAKDEQLYIYVGQGVAGINTSAFNATTASSGGGNPGGGATDVRLVSGSWNNTAGLRSRIMVAGGGGSTQGGNWGGAAGGLIGYSSSRSGYTNTGGTQTGPGVGQENPNGCATGSFGIGSTCGATGGGGYYGGGGASHIYGSGSGGSSYISGHTGSVAITSADNQSPKSGCTTGTTDTECSYHYSGKVFSDTVMIDGLGYNWTNVKGEYVGMPTTSGSGTEAGHAGHGYAKITLADSDNYLLSLTTNRGDFTPKFDKFTLNYTLELDSEVTDIKLEARLSSDFAVVEGLGTHEVKAGVNIYPIKVTAESGDVKTYTLTVTRPASTTSTAMKIDVTGFIEQICKGKEGYCELNPEEYNKEHLTYGAKVPAGIRELEFTVAKDHYYQKVIGDGVTRLRGENNSISIIVKSEYCDLMYPNETLPQECLDDGSATVYTYNIYRDMTGDNYLDQLQVVNPEIDIGFNYLLTEYNFRVDNEVESLDLHILPDDPRATFEIIGFDSTITGDNVDGFDVHIDGLQVGNNIVEVRVTAANGEQRSYVINAYRLANGNTLLADLQVFNGSTEYELTPAFVDTTVNYTLSVPNEVSSVKITATPKVSTTRATGDVGTLSLNTGLNQFKVLSTAENGNVEVYTIVITRAKSDNAYLSTLSALEGRFNESFVKTTNNYTMTVEPHVKKLNLNIIPEEEHATYVVNGNNNFKIGNNTVTIIVTAENGKKNTYTITVNKLGSDVNTLDTLTVSSGTLSPTFTPNTTQYNVTVENDITSISVDGTLTDYLASVKGFGSYKLVTGNNTINIVVTSETGITKTYTLTVFRKYNANNYASDIWVSNPITGNAFEMNPPFNKEGNDVFEVNVPSDVEDIVINATLEVPSTSTVTGTGGKHVEPGINEFTVTVTAENNDTKDYTIRVVRDRALNSNLSELVVKEARLNPTFLPVYLNYNAKVLYDIDKINVIAIPEDEQATVKIYNAGGNEISFDNIPVEVGDNTFTIKVFAYMGNVDYDYKEYTIYIRRLSEEESPELRLKSLNVNSEYCSLEFDEKTYYYECNVPYDIAQIEVDSETKESDDKVYGNGIYDLEKGNNFIDLSVTNNNFPDVERIYKVNIIRAHSPESKLKMIKVFDEELEGFDPETLEYNYTTDEYELDLDFEKFAGVHEEFIVQDIKVTGNENFELGSNNKVYIKVTSEDKVNTTTYVINVTRNIRKNAYLKTLSIDEGELNPEFTKEITNYIATVPFEVNSLIITAEAEDKNATITGNGMVSLDVGENVFDVVVTAENGTTQKTYRLTITRLGDPNNYLKSLDIEGFTFTPQFDKNVNNYTLNVDYEVDKITINATPEVDTASIIGDGEINLKQGVNNINIYVIAENGDVRTYTIKVVRKDPITSKLLDIKVKNYELDPTFDPDTLVYSVTVDYETSKLDFIITKMDPYSTYEIVGNESFNLGLNTVQIVVTSSNRIDQTVYTFIVNRQTYSNTFLSYLGVNQGSLDPVFDKTTLSYTVEVGYNVERISIDASPDYPLSTVSGIGDYPINIGDNLIKITVTSPSGIKRIYNVNVVRKKSSNANIDTLTSNIGDLTKIDDYNYKLVVPKTTKNIGAANFKVKPQDSMASVSMPTTIDLKQTKVYPINITSPDGTVTKEYDVAVEFGLSGDATLAALIPDVGSLSPSFKPSTNEYTIDLFDDVDEEIFDLYLNQVNAKLLNRTLTFPLNDYETEAKIMVQAENGTLNIYTVTIRKSKTKQKQLDNVIVRNGINIDEIIESDIPFSPNDYNYDLGEVEYEVNKLNFDIAKKHQNQRVKLYNNNELVYTNETDARFDKDINLSVGTNNIKLEVTNALNETTTYNYTVVRKTSTNANLESITIKSEDNSKVYSLIPEFDPEETDYYVQIPYSTEHVNVTAIPEDPTQKTNPAAVTINGATYLPEGETDITITSRAPAGNRKIYTVHVLRTPLINNLIRNVTITSGNIYQFEPRFRPGYTGGSEGYSMTVPSAIRTIHIDAIPDDAGTTISFNGITTEAGVNYSSDYVLSVGQNIITLVATNQGESRTYKLVINRLSDNNAELLDIKVLNGRLEERFDSLVLEYDVSVDTDITSLDLVVKPEDQNATYVITGNEDFTYEGPNVVSIKVTSANGATSKTYKLTVHQKGDPNNYLSDITIDNETIEGFDKYKQTYDIVVDYDVDRINLNAIPESLKAHVSSTLGFIDLEVGLNEIEIVNVAQDGGERSYKLNITREANAYLSGIGYTIKGESDTEQKSYLINPFDRNTYEYNIELENDIDKINVMAYAEDVDNALISGQGLYPLQVGNNPILITVRNGNAKKVYTLNVKRKGSSNKNLKYLTSTDGDIFPEYSNDIDEYTIHIPNYKTKLSLSYEVEHPGTKVTYDNNIVDEDQDGLVDIILTVTAEDGSTKFITVHTYLEDATYFSSRLQSLNIAEGSISPKFDPDTLLYSITVPQTIEELHISAVAESPNAIVAGDGVKPLELGKNVLPIIVTAEDGSTTTYEIVAFRKDMSNADLTGLYTDIGELDPEFDPKTNTYTIKVPAETEKIHLTAVAYAEKTIIGDGDVKLHKGVTVRNIMVTSEDGTTNTYVVNIDREFSNNPTITNITINRTGLVPATFDPDTFEYRVTVPDSIHDVTFTVTTESKLTVAYVGGEALTNDTDSKVSTGTRELEYGDNEIIVYGLAEDDQTTTSEYKYIVHRIHDLHNITFPDYEICGAVDPSDPRTVGDNKCNYKISVPPGGIFELEPTFDPEDADYTDVTYQVSSGNGTWITVNNDGLITAQDVLDKYSYVKVTSKTYPNVSTMIKVTVEITEITSPVYEVRRDIPEYDNHIRKIELLTSIQTFLDNLDNDQRFLHVYDKNGIEITDYSKKVGTGMVVKLENNNHTYDQLDIIVTGDISGDGKCDAIDLNNIKLYLLTKLDFNKKEFMASDTNFDEKVDAVDLNQMKLYNLTKLDSFLQ